SGAWNADQQQVSLNLSVPAPTAPGDWLWLIVSDEMVPTAYRLPNPSFQNLIVKAEIQELPSSQMAMQVPPTRPPGTVGPVQPQGGATAPQRVPDDQVQPIDETSQSDTADLRKAVAEANTLLEEYGLLLREAEESEEKLLVLARARGLVPAAGRTDAAIAVEALARVRPSRQAPRGPVQAAPLQPQWLRTIAQGGQPQAGEQPGPAPVTPEVRQSASVAAASLTQRLQGHRAAVSAAPAIAQRLQSGFGRAQRALQDPNLRQNTQQAVQALRRALVELAPDEQLLSAIELRRQALAQIGNEASGYREPTAAGLPQQPQPTAQAQPTPGQPGQPPVATVQPVGAGAMSETFETQPLQGWELSPGVQVQQVGQGHALVFGQAGVAWAPTGAQDFALSFKYRPATGPMEAVVRASGEPQNQRGYHVMLMPGEVVLLREFGQGNMTELDGAACQFQSGAWNQVGLQVSGGQLTVSVGGQQLMSATDAQPLPAGGVGFMSQQGGDAIDDVSLTSAAGGAATPTATTTGQPATAAGQQPAVGPVVQPPVGQPGQPPVATVQPVGAATMSETFDAGQPQQGWEFGGGAAVQNGALTFNSPGEAWWIAVQQRD
ncbi:MAG: hypothetical protein ACP5KN_19285, partial [Armatimonadota bacterium]